ncbi:MAG: hypothetical protein O2857_28065, partial [Planctomycetota bacterium]|nr:hypothetical protein [Planctomycetota bacterium]
KWPGIRNNELPKKGSELSGHRTSAGKLSRPAAEILTVILLSLFLIRYCRKHAQEAFKAEIRLWERTNNYS